MTYRVTTRPGLSNGRPHRATVTDALHRKESYNIVSKADVLVNPPATDWAARTRSRGRSHRRTRTGSRSTDCESTSAATPCGTSTETSAKREDLLVKEFTDNRSDRTLLVAAEAQRGHADEMAAAAATITMAALESGLAVELAVPNGAVEQGYGDTHRTRLLELLARADAVQPAGQTTPT